ncbi:MAG: chloride channel protein [Actinomycetota bacterium]
MLGVGWPLLFGSGIEGINAALAGKLAAGTLDVLLSARSPPPSRSARAPRGVFSPSLFMGAMLGSLYGTALHAALVLSRRPKRTRWSAWRPPSRRRRRPRNPAS